MRDPVVNDAGLEERAEHGVDGFDEIRAAVEHELRGVGAQQTAGQKPYGYLDLDALGLGYGIVVHEPFDLEQGDVALHHQPVDDPLEVGGRQQLEPLHERPRYARGGRRRVHYVHRPRRGHCDQLRVQYLFHPGELCTVSGYRHETAQRRFVRHVDDHAVPQPVHHERPETAPDGPHAQRLVDGRVVHEKQYGVHAVQLFQLSKEMEHACSIIINNKFIYFNIATVVHIIIVLLLFYAQLHKSFIQFLFYFHELQGLIKRINWGREVRELNFTQTCIVTYNGGYIYVVQKGGENKSNHPRLHNIFIWVYSIYQSIVTIILKIFFRSIMGNDSLITTL